MDPIAPASIPAESTARRPKTYQTDDRQPGAVEVPVDLSDDFIKSRCLVT
jgi:hypothetical protein